MRDTKSPEKSDFGALKLEGITDAPVNICVTCDPTRDAPDAAAFLPGHYPLVLAIDVAFTSSVDAASFG